VVERVVDIPLLVDRVLGVLHVLYGSRVVEPRRISLAPDRRQIDERVGAVAADDPDGDAASHTALNGRPIIPIMQVDADLLRLGEIEPTREIRSVVSRLQPHIHDPVASSDHGRLVVGVSGVNVGVAEQLVVIAIGY